MIVLQKYDICFSHDIIVIEEEYSSASVSGQGITETCATDRPPQHPRSPEKQTIPILERGDQLKPNDPLFWAESHIETLGCA